MGPPRTLRAAKTGAGSGAGRQPVASRSQLLNDEGHMGAGGAIKLAPLRATSRIWYARVRPARLAWLGCGPVTGILDVVH